MPKLKRHKMNAKAVKNCEHCGMNHPSQAEALRCGMWHDLKKQGRILHVDVHPTVTLPSGNFTPDFAIYTTDEPAGDAITVFYEEVKGQIKADFRLKWIQFDKYHPMRPLFVVARQHVKGKGQQWVKVRLGQKREDREIEVAL